MTLKTDKYQVGLDSVTDTNNFLLQTNGAGNIHLHRGSDGTGPVVLRVKPDNTVEFPLTPAAFSKYFESTDQIITAGALLTLAHGLGTVTKLWHTYLRCTTADAGYAAGDILIDPGFTGASGLYGCAFVPDATNLVGRIVNNPNPFGGTNRTTGAAVAFTSANWRIFVRAWA